MDFKSVAKDRASRSANWLTHTLWSDNSFYPRLWRRILPVLALVVFIYVLDVINKVSWKHSALVLTVIGTSWIIYMAMSKRSSDEEPVGVRLPEQVDDDSHLSTLVAPSPYTLSLHWRACAIPSVNIVLLNILFITIMVAVNIYAHVWEQLALIPLSMFVSAFLIRREWWKWRYRPLKCDPRDGRLRVVQKRNMWLLLRGSSDDIYPLGEGDTVIDTPKQTIMESFFFRRSQTLILRANDRDSSVKLKQRYVVDVDHLMAIDAYRRELMTMSVTDQRASIRVLEAMLAEQRNTNALLLGKERPVES